MNQRWTLSLVAALIVAFASSAYAAAPLTLDRHQASVERVAPPFPTVPGRTFCICQTANDFSTTYVGYLNSFTFNAGGDTTVNIVCAYPVFTPGVGTAFCPLFEVVK